MNIRFLNTDEYSTTKPLATECFGESQELDDYYINDIEYNRVVVLEEDKKLCSMAHLKRVIADFGDYSEPVWYIAYVCTAKDFRHRGYMNAVMNFLLKTLQNEGEKFTFLVPVNKELYINLGFTHSWRFNQDEAELLYADDGLCECYACSFHGTDFETPRRIMASARIEDFNYIKFDADATYKYFEYFYIRPNRSFYSVPLDCLIWNEVVDTECCVLDDRCFVMKDKGDGGVPSGCLPFCRENELVYYFKLQQKYFNEVLKIPFCAFLADTKGINYLKSAGALDNYEIIEDREIYDYIYSAESLRTLAGRKFAKKRNHINNFMHNYDGRWEYRSLGADDRNEILVFLKEWHKNKNQEIESVNYGDDYGTDQTLDIELQGVESIIASTKLMSKIKVGGIYIDGKLCAFSLGSFNPIEKMAVIEVEKAFSDYDGLYQLINREFLIHEFPDAEFVNREDDMGLDGLRKSKMSYRPIYFEKRYSIYQKDFKK